MLLGELGAGSGSFLGASGVCRRSGCPRQRHRWAGDGARGGPGRTARMRRCWPSSRRRRPRHVKGRPSRSSLSGAPSGTARAPRTARPGGCVYPYAMRHPATMLPSSTHTTRARQRSAATPLMPPTPLRCRVGVAGRLRWTFLSSSTTLLVAMRHNWLVRWLLPRSCGRVGPQPQCPHLLVSNRILSRIVGPMLDPRKENPCPPTRWGQGWWALLDSNQ